VSPVLDTFSAAFPVISPRSVATFVETILFVYRFVDDAFEVILELIITLAVAMFAVI
jgi:hypothetical protein